MRMAGKSMTSRGISENIGFEDVAQEQIQCVIRERVYGRSHSPPLTVKDLSNNLNL